MKPDKSSLTNILLEHSDTIQAPALRAAAEKFKKQQEDAAAERAFEMFQAIQRNIADGVNRLRNIRKQEEKEKNSVLALNAAMEAFKKDGDIEKCRAASIAAIAIRH